VAEICREHDLSETLLRRWRDQMVEAGAERFTDGQDRSLAAEQRRRIAELERALGKKTYELEVSGKLLRDCFLRDRVSAGRRGLPVRRLPSGRRYAGMVRGDPHAKGRRPDRESNGEAKTDGFAVNPGVHR
jgi:transposase-like protein